MYILYAKLQKRDSKVLESYEDLPKNTLCQVWLKLAEQFWKSRKCGTKIDIQPTEHLT